MADRYWVPGGDGSWTSASNWSATSGGSGGASVPTALDNVFFNDNSSAGDYTVGGGNGICLNFTITGSRNITFSVTVIQINGAVSDTSSGTVSYTSNSGIVLLAAGSVNIRFGNRTITGPLTFGAGTYTLVSSNLTVNNSFFIGTAGGTVNMGSNTVSCRQFGFSSVNGTFNLNSCTLDITPQFAGDQTVIVGSNNTSTRVINAGTSTIIFRLRGATGNCPLTDTTGYTFYEVRVKDNNEFIQTSNSSSLQLRASTTISRLSFDNTNSAQVNPYLNVRLLGNVTINNFIAVNSNAMRRMMVFTQPGTSPYTITTNSAPTGLTDVTFFNVTVTGSAAPITGTRVVAINGTTGVTPSAGKTVYWNKATGGNWVVNDAYAASSGGTVDVNNFPLPQDTVIIEDTGLNTSATITMNTAEGFNDNASTLAKQTVGSIDMSTRTNAMTFGFGTSSDFYTWSITGSFKCGSGTTLTDSFNFMFIGSGDILSSGKTIRNTNYNYVQINASGTYTLLDALNTSTSSILLTAGGLNTAGYNVTAASLGTSNSNVRSLTLGASLLTFSSGDPFATTDSTNLTISLGTSIISSTSNSVTFASVNNAQTINARVGTTQDVTVTTTKTFNDFSVLPTLSAFGTRTVTLASNITANGQFSIVTGTSAQRTLLVSSSVGVQRTVTSASVSLKDTTFRDIVAAGASTPWSGSGLLSLGNNSNITFGGTGRTVYWVTAAGGNWTASNWSLSSGGSVTEDAFPRPEDTAVIEDTGLNASATITLNNVANFNYLPNVDMSTRTNAMTMAFSTAYTCNGNFTCGSGTAFSGTQVLTFSPLVNSSLTSSGKTFSNGLTVNGIYGAKFSLADAANIGGNTFTLTSGELDTAGFNLTAGILNSNNSNVRTLTLGSSVITLANNDPIITATATNLTINLGTSWISCTGNALVFTNLSASTFFNVRVGVTQNASVNTTKTFNDFSISGASVAFTIRTITLISNLTVNNQFSVSTVNSSRRVSLLSSAAGTQRTITAASVSLERTTFKDIAAAGASAPWSGTGLLSDGNNSNITFGGGVGRTVYWVTAAGGNWTASNWALSSGGSIDEAAFPEPQDTAVIENTGLNASATITLNSVTGYNFLSSVNMSTRTNAMTMSFATAYTCYGNFTCGSGTSFTGTSVLSFSPLSNSSLTSAGKTFSNGLTVNGIYGAKLSLADAANIGTNTLTHTIGEFDTAGFSLTAGVLNSNNSNVRTLTLGSSVITLSSNDPINTVTATNLTLSLGTSWISCTGNALTFLSMSVLAPFNIRVGATQNTSISNARTYNNFDVTASLTSFTIRTVSLGANPTINGTFSTSTGGPDQRLSIFSSVANTRRIVSAGAVSLSNTNFTGIEAAGTASPFSGTGLADLGNNLNINFTAVGKTVYWVTAAGGNWTGNNFAALSGGAASLANFPLPEDTVVIENTGLNNATTLTLNNVAGFNYLPTVNMSTRTNTVTMAFATAYNCFGSFTCGSGTGFSGTQRLTFRPGANSTLTSAGKAFSTDVFVEASDSSISFSLVDALNMGTRTLGVTRGIFNTANFNITGAVFNSSSALDRVLNLGTSLITLSNGDPIATTVVTGLTITSSAYSMNCTSNALTFASLSISPLFNVRVGATQNTNISNSRSFNVFEVVAPATTGIRFITFTSGVRTTVNNLNSLSTSVQQRVFIGGQTAGVSCPIIILNGVTVSDCDFRDVRAISTTITGTRLGDYKGNTGITFSSKTVYWNLAGAQNWNAVAWADTPTGTPNANNFPLPQDTATFTNSGSVTGTITLNNNGLNYVPTIDMSGRTNAMTLSFGVAYTVYGNWINGSGVTLSGAQTLTFAGRGTNTITSAGKAFPGGITVDSIGGSLEPADNLNIGGNTLTVTYGKFDSKNFNITAGGIASTNSNVRFITLGSSTVTLSGTGVINFSTPTNLTFSAGTSQITCNSTSAFTFNGGNQTFYNVSFTGNAVVTRTISGVNTFNNLSVTAGTNGLATTAFSSNQIITGTLTVSGSSAIQRGYVRSDTPGTARTLTVGTLVADDCDFRDVTIAGGAAGSTPTRAGNCGNNTGITFSSKSVYWNLAGSQNWNANGWAASSGASPAVDNFPLPQDTAVFDDAGSAGTVSVGTVAYNFPTINASARTSAMTLTHNGAQEIYGDYTLGSGVTVSGTSGLTFASTSPETITTAGKTITFPITIGLAGRTSTSVSLSGTYTASSSITLTSGTFNAANNDITVTAFSSSNSNVRTLTMGSGLWSLSGTGTVWDTGTITNLTFNKNTANIELTNTTTTARSFGGGGLAFNKLTIGGATGTSTLTINGNNTFTELASTKTVAHTILFANNGTTAIGKWSVTGTVGNVVTLNRVSTGSWNLVLVGDIPTSINYLAVNNCVVADTSPAEFYVGPNSTLATSTRVVNTAPPAARTLYWVGGTGNWSDTARWSLGSGGAGGQAIPTSLDDVVFDNLSNATAYTATVNVTARCKSLTVAGPASGNLTFAGTSTLICHGNVSFPATGFTRTFTGAVILGSTATGLTYTTNGQVFASSVTINGVGCSWSLGSALNIGATTLNVTNGSFDTGNYNLTCNDLVSNNLNTRAISLGSSTVALASATPVNLTPSINLTFNAGTSTLSCTSTTPVFNGNGLTYYNLTFTNGGITAKTINGSNTFNDLTANCTTAGLMPVVFNADQTVNGTLTVAGNSAINRAFARSGTVGTVRTITAAVLAANDCDFRDITIAGVAAGTTPTRAGDCGGNTGITFSSKTVYWNLAGAQNWNANGWATTDNGTPNVVNFPLAQDTATFTDSGAAGTVSVGTVVYNFPAVDASTRTAAMTLGHNGAQEIYGSYTLGSGVTISGTSALTFAGTSTQTITTAGKTILFPITVGLAGRIVTAVPLADNFTSSSSITLTSGTFDAVTYDVTITALSSTNGNVRTLTMGSGLWSITGINTTIWDFGNPVNATFNKGSADIILTNTGTQQRTFNGGNLTYNKLTIGGATGIATVTITGDNTFTELASTKTVAHTIALGSTTQRIGAWTITGTVGNVVSITGTGSNLIYTSSGNTDNIDYLNIQGRAFGPSGETTGVWYGGVNSTDSGTYGWLFEGGTPPPPPGPSNGNFFLLFA